MNAGGADSVNVVPGMAPLGCDDINEVSTVVKLIVVTPAVVLADPTPVGKSNSTIPFRLTLTVLISAPYCHDINTEPSAPLDGDMTAPMKLKPPAPKYDADFATP